MILHRSSYHTLTGPVWLLLKRKLVLVCVFSRCVSFVEDESEAKGTSEVGSGTDEEDEREDASGGAHGGTA